jgi:hypothetical protein
MEEEGEGEREVLVGTVPKPSVHTPVSTTHALEDFSKPQDQDTEGWITVKNSRKKAVTFFVEPSN